MRVERLAGSEFADVVAEVLLRLEDEVGVDFGVDRQVDVVERHRRFVGHADRDVIGPASGERAGVRLDAEFQLFLAVDVERFGKRGRDVDRAFERFEPPFVIRGHV